jgi:excisionase family DNA binding protein
MTEQKSLLTINETAKAFEVPAFFVRTKVKTGEIPVFKAGTRVYISREVFREYLAGGGQRYDAGQLAGR